MVNGSWVTQISAMMLAGMISRWLVILVALGFWGGDYVGEWVKAARHRLRRNSAAGRPGPPRVTSPVSRS
jgi:hypothetical protein